MAEAVHAIGIDAGSTTTKISAVGADGSVLWSRIEPADPRVEEQVSALLESAGLEAGAGPNTPLVATGYGRRLVHVAVRSITEITCHARGIFHEFARAGTLVDIGGQDSKAVAIGPDGKVLDFAMNDRCAAGTGRFLENTARRLGVALQEIGPRALTARDEVAISSTCTVFAESEVVSLLAQGVAIDTVLRGLHRALVRRISSMIRTVGLTPPLMLAGGVACNPAVPRMLADETGLDVLVSQQPQFTGALGAALIALAESR